MENIERTQFVVLTGHLDDQPLPDIIRTLRVQRKSGRLQVEYPDAPGSFFFEDGQLVDAQLGTLRGVEALYAALSLHGAAFNFNPLVRPPERSIDKQEQKFIWDLVEAPRREGLSEIRVADGELTAPPTLPTQTQNAPLQLAPAPAEFMAPLIERMTAVETAIISASRRFSRERLIYSLVISFLVGLILTTLLQFIYGSFRLEPTGAARSGQKSNATISTVGGEAAQGAATAPVNREPAGGALSDLDRAAAAQPSDAARRAEQATQQAQPTGPDAISVREAPKTGRDSSAHTEYVVHIRMRVKNGQVIGARVLNSRPGASDDEARALKLAMQHQYPAGFTGGDTLKIIVEH